MQRNFAFTLCVIFWQANVFTAAAETWKWDLEIFFNYKASDLHHSSFISLYHAVISQRACSGDVEANDSLRGNIN